MNGIALTGRCSNLSKSSPLVNAAISIFKQTIDTAVVEQIEPITPIKVIKLEQVKPKKEQEVKPKPKIIPKKQEIKPVIKQEVTMEPVVEQVLMDKKEQAEPLETTSSNMNSVNTSALSSSILPSAGSNLGQTSDSSNKVSRDDAWNGYGKLLYAMVSKNKNYPQIAIRRNLEGTVMVSIRFEYGKAVEITVLGQGSGHNVLDKAASDMIDKAIKELPVQGDLRRKSFTVVVPVNFRLLS